MWRFVAGGGEGCLIWLMFRTLLVAGLVIPTFVTDAEGEGPGDDRSLFGVVASDGCSLGRIREGDDVTWRRRNRSVLL